MKPGCEKILWPNFVQGVLVAPHCARLRLQSAAVCAQDKIDVNGEAAHPLYKFLRAQQPVSQPSSKMSGNLFGETGSVEWNCALPSPCPHPYSYYCCIV